MMNMPGLRICLLACALVTGASQSYNTDEWYDPTDWFDGNNYEYDDTLDLDYGPGEGFPGAYDGTYDADIYWDNMDYDYNLPDWNQEGKTRSGRNWRAIDRSQGNEGNEWRKSKETYRNQNVRRAIVGTIDELRTLDLRDSAGKRDSHDVVHVTMRDGQTALIDLGPARKRQFQLKEGDWVDFLGEPGQISGRNVLFADSATVDGRTYRISRSKSDNRASVSGKIENVTTVYLNNDSGETRRFVEVSLDDGNEYLLDLGPKRTVREGERVQLKGRNRNVSGRNVIAVDQLRVNGNTVTLSSSAG